jgi:SAM-dependent methyltransferase
MTAEDPTCSVCHYEYSRKAGYLSFLSKNKINDSYRELEESTAFLRQEDSSTRLRFKRYFVPLFKAWGMSRSSRILCLGCGGAADVLELHENGFRETYGIDIEWRCLSWKEMGMDPRHLFIADGISLPFEDNYFDVVITLGVIEHIGAVGATAELNGNYKAMRTKFLSEAFRILNSQGTLIVACPNRTFPIDFQHNISKLGILKKMGVKAGLSIHSPFNRFLLSYSDIRKYVERVKPTARIKPLPIHSYLGLTFRNSPFLSPLALMANAYLALLDHLPAFIRSSFMNPYMICAIRA